jgi:Holliday junction resolvase RusA-like endonuclease
VIRLTILGQPCSKANRRQLVTIGNRPALIKSKEALAYERDALRQIPPALRQQLDGPCRITIRVFYETERPDLDPSVVLDCLQDRYEKVKGERVLMQKGIVKNDRQFREMHLYHAIDKRNPRAEIEIEPIQAQQPDMLDGVPRGTPADMVEEPEPF